MSTYLAVDLGGTKIAAALIKSGVIIEKKQIETSSSASPNDLKQALSTLLLPMANRADKVAVASTGIINNGVLTALNPSNLGGLNTFPIQAFIASLTGLTTTVVNDAQAAAWAEYIAYEGQYLNLAFITVSTGVGAGFVLDGKLLIGSRGIAGHAGHMLSDPNGPLCGCGRKGCVEAIASGRAMGLAGQEYFNLPCSGQDVYSHYLDGNLPATAIVHRSAAAIAQLIADLTISLDLDAVVLGGGVGLAKNYRALVERELLTLPTIYRPMVLPALCGTDAGVIGVSQWAEMEIS